MSFWHGKRVLVTGHTGFKGAWLTLWLVKLGARVTGIALDPDTTPSLFVQLGLVADVDHQIIDIRDRAGVEAVIARTAPDVVFHLAAQALVRRGYREPVETWSANVMGTIHVLDALRRLDRDCAAVIVTTDKVYENRSWEYGYRETDELGGHDPYSASKAAAEIAVGCWRRSFLATGGRVRVASARAGNVIGGGDWSEDRIVPDLVRSLARKLPVTVRNPQASRPWQHVLEPLGGYMLLAERLAGADGARLATAFNFGPTIDSERSVRDLVEESLTHWKGTWVDGSSSGQPHEAVRLSLAIDRARIELDWSPRWSFARAVRETIDWYRHSQDLPCGKIRELSLALIDSYEASPVGAAT